MRVFTVKAEFVDHAADIDDQFIYSFLAESAEAAAEAVKALHPGFFVQAKEATGTPVMLFDFCEEHGLRQHWLDTLHERQQGEA